jgi:predicted ribosomally synthesized peptide with SipW-like signal peptide
VAISAKKKLVAGAAIAVGSLALIGAGSGASFTDTVTAQTNVRSGHADLNIVKTDGATATYDGASHQTYTWASAAWNIVDGNYAVLNGEKLLASSTSRLVTEFTVENDGTAGAGVSFEIVKSGDLKDKLDIQVERVDSTTDKDWLNKGATAKYRVAINVKNLDNSSQNLTGSVAVKVTATS